MAEHGPCDVLVTAGAGSGKTHVLVERYLSLLAGCAVGEVAFQRETRRLEGEL